MTKKSFFFSIITAVLAGLLISFGVIKSMAIISTIGASEDEGEDSTFIYHFSRVFKYSTVDSVGAIGELLENKDNQPTQTGSGDISALSYIVLNVDRDTVLLEKSAEQLLPLASITKIVTAVIAKRLLIADDQIAITSKILSIEGDTGRLRLGEKMKVVELLYPLLMVSSNDSAYALSSYYDSIYGKGEFVKAMNDWVSSVGAYRTYFKDSSGLSPSNLSTAKDISIIAKWIRKNEPSIFDITMTKTKSIRTHTWVNPTHFLNLSAYEGGKNGYTPEANRTSVSLFSIDSPKRLYIVVLLGSKQRDEDTLAVLNKVLR
ncbi:MAG TPA: hypothetical protein VJJ28_01200 [Candidatus Paceibacterota bacterium]